MGVFIIIEKIFNVLDKIFDKIESAGNKAVHLLDILIDAFFWFLFSALDRFFKAVLGFLNLVEEIYKANAKTLRILAMPTSALIPLGYKLFKRPTFNKYPILQQGMHMVRAKVGGGKSLTSFVLAEMTLKEYGLASYLTSAVEKPQLSEDKKYWYVMHRVIDPKDYYSKGKKVMNYNTDMYPYYHKDERHLQYNPRLNKKRNYNDTFIPEHEDELLMRHQGFRLIIKYSQHMKLDSQEMDTLTYMHDVRTVKDLSVFNWLRNGSFRSVPIKLKFTTYVIESQFDGTMKRKKYKSWSIPVSQDILDRYDTHAESKKHEGLKVDYKRKKVR